MPSSSTECVQHSAVQCPTPSVHNRITRTINQNSQNRCHRSVTTTMSAVAEKNDAQCYTEMASYNTHTHTPKVAQVLLYIYTFVIKLYPFCSLNHNCAARDVQYHKHNII